MAVQIILKNSTIEDKRPTPSQLTSGELSLNYNAAGAFLCCTDTDGNVQQVGGIKINETAPSTPVTQTLWLQPSTQTLSIYDGSAWIPVVGSDGVAPVTSVNTQTGDVVLDFSDVGAASAAQGALADTALQPGDDVSELVNDAAYITLADVPPIPPQAPPVITSSTAPLDADSENGYLWFNTNDGRTYVYYQDVDSSQWVDASPENADPGVLPDINNPAQQPGTIDDRYVNVTGDNMTGNLTLSTNKVFLNSVDGSGQFAGDVTVGSASEISLVAADGSASFKEGRCRVNTDGNLQLSVDGTGYDGTKNSGALQLSRYGSLAINNQDNANDASYAFSAEKHDGAGNVTLNSAITIGGSAFFAKDIQSTSQNSGPLAGFRNLIINGDMKIWQRGSSGGAITSGGAYTADHIFMGSGITSWTRAPLAGTAPGLEYGMRFSGGANIYIAQPIELLRVGYPNQFATGTTWTYSFYSTASDNMARVYFSDTSVPTNEVDIFPEGAVTSLGNNRYSVTFTVAAAPQITNTCLVCRAKSPTGAQLEITGFQLEPGPVATPFEHRPIGTELALCQRYYQHYDSLNAYVYVPDQPTNRRGGTAIPPMRVTPTMSATTSYSPNFSPTSSNVIGWTTNSVSTASNHTLTDVIADAEL